MTIPVKSIDIPRGDYGAYTFPLTDSTGAAKAFVGYTATLKVWVPGKQHSPFITGACVLSAGSTVATYNFAATDFPSIGKYYAEIECTKTGERASTYNFIINVLESA